MTFADYVGISAEEYEKFLDEAALGQAAQDYTYEAIFKESGISLDNDVYQQIVDYFGGEETALSTYGEPYLKQTAIKYSVIQYLKQSVTVTGAPTE